MLINSYYDDLGFREMYQNRIAELREESDFEFQLHANHHPNNLTTSDTDYSDTKHFRYSNKTMTRWDDNTDAESEHYEEFSEGNEEDSAEEERKYKERILANPQS